MTNESFEYQPASKLWRYREHWAGDTATRIMGSFEARVVDMDGDATCWSVKRNGEVIGEGEFSCVSDWDLAMQAAEQCLASHGSLFI